MRVMNLVLGVFFNLGLGFGACRMVSNMALGTSYHIPNKAYFISVSDLLRKQPYNRFAKCSQLKPNQKIPLLPTPSTPLFSQQ
jgi:hypothetical protein